MTSTAHKKESWFAPKLRAELDRAELKTRAFARMWRPDDVENARRSLLRYLNDGKVPGPEIRAELETALGLKPGALDEDEEDEAVARFLVAAEGLFREMLTTFVPRREVEHEA